MIAFSPAVFSLYPAVSWCADTTSLTLVLKYVLIVKLQVLDRGLGVDFTFTLDNNDNDNPHLYFLKGTVLGDMEQKIVLLLVANGVVSMIGDHSGTSLLKLQMDYKNKSDI